MKETAKTHYKKQLDKLHSLLWQMDCYHVNLMNKADEQAINWGDCGSLGHVIDELQGVINFIDGREE